MACPAAGDPGALPGCATVNSATAVTRHSADECGTVRPRSSLCACIAAFAMLAAAWFEACHYRISAAALL